VKPQRILTLIAGMGLFVALIPATTSIVLGWSPPTIGSVCSTDQAVHSWTVTLATESNYVIQWADNSGFSGATTVTMHQGANSLSTPSSVTTLYGRWNSDHNSKSSAVWGGGACASPFQSFQGETSQPTVKPTDPCIVVGNQPAAFTTPNPCPTPFQSFQGETSAPSVKPTEEATPKPTERCETDVDLAVARSSETPCKTVDPTQTPFQSFQGETAVASQNPTPPPTSTGGDGSGSSSTPLFAVLISLALGVIGLIAVQAQRRTVRR
jgi:hypothetical protein